MSQGKLRFFRIDRDLICSRNTVLKSFLLLKTKSWSQICLSMSYLYTATADVLNVFI